MPNKSYKSHAVNYNVLAIDTSCDETSAAITQGSTVLSNVVWSQASLHARFGGVYPALAQREHEKRINWVVEKAINNSKLKIQNLDYIAVTVGPGLAIALGVGIDKAKELAVKYHKPLIPINHLEGHLLSSLANSNSKVISQKSKPDPVHFPAFGLVVSGGNTQLILVENIGKYKILAETVDDALGEALDKGARMLGLGYPGGAILERFAKEGNPKTYNLPTPLAGQEDRQIFSYSGIKTALYKLIQQTARDKKLNKKLIRDLAAAYQDVAFNHLVRVVSFSIENCKLKTENLFIGGGVAANVELRKRIRSMCKRFGITPLFPYSKKLYGDNAAMIGVAAGLKAISLKVKTDNLNQIDRKPRFSLDEF